MKRKKGSLVYLPSNTMLMCFNEDKYLERHDRLFKPSHAIVLEDEGFSMKLFIPNKGIWNVSRGDIYEPRKEKHDKPEGSMFEGEDSYRLAR